MNARKNCFGEMFAEWAKPLSYVSADNPAEYTEIIEREFRYILRGGVNTGTTGFARGAPLTTELWFDLNSAK